MHIHIFIYVYVYKYVYVHVYVIFFMNMYAYVYVYIHTQIYVHITYSLKNAYTQRYNTHTHPLTHTPILRTYTQTHNTHTYITVLEVVTSIKWFPNHAKTCEHNTRTLTHTNTHRNRQAHRRTHRHTISLLEGDHFNSIIFHEFLWSLMNYFYFLRWTNIQLSGLLWIKFGFKWWTLHSTLVLL